MNVWLTGLNPLQLTRPFKWAFDWLTGPTQNERFRIDGLNQPFNWRSESTFDWGVWINFHLTLSIIVQLTVSINLNWGSESTFPNDVLNRLQLTVSVDVLNQLSIDPLNHLQLTVSINLNWGSWKINFFKKINFSIDPLNHLQLKGFSINFHFWAHTPPVYRAAVKTHQRK